MYDKILLEKYIAVRENASGDVTHSLSLVKELISKVATDETAVTELSNAFNQLLLNLLNSTDGTLKNAAAGLLNDKTAVANEEDEAIGNGNDNTTGVTGTGF